MSNILWPIIISTIAGLSTVIGSFIVFLKISRENINKFIAFCLAFSLSIMICISITDLIPESTFIISSNYGKIIGTLICIGTFLVGSFLINVINKKINSVKEGGGDLYKLGILSMFALILHNFPEGIAIFMSAYKDIGSGISLGLAIMLHNIPEGISIAVPIYYATGKKTIAIKHTLLSGLAEPFGAIIAYMFLSKYITDVFIAIILIFVAGIMITLAIQELLPQTLKYKEEKWSLMGIVMGFLIIFINHFLL